MSGGIRSRGAGSQYADNDIELRTGGRQHSSDSGWSAAGYDDEEDMDFGSKKEFAGARNDIADTSRQVHGF